MMDVTLKELKELYLNNPENIYMVDISALADEEDAE